MKTFYSDCLVIPDVHQNIRWVESILSKEESAVDRVIFLGDYFDPKVSSASTARETARYFSSLPECCSKKLTFLAGNHDLPYLYDIQRGQESANTVYNPYTLGGYSLKRSMVIASELDPEFIASLEPFVFAYDWLLSHAGIHRYYCDTRANFKDPNMEPLYQELKSEIDSLSDDKNEALAAVGPCRGGLDAFGGITWLDWIMEFHDSLPWAQVVGHTLLDNAEKKGRSWNLDSMSGSYAILSGDGIEIKNEPKE